MIKNIKPSWIFGSILGFVISIGIQIDNTNQSKSIDKQIFAYALVGIVLLNVAWVTWRQSDTESFSKQLKHVYPLTVYSASWLLMRTLQIIVVIIAIAFISGLLTNLSTQITFILCVMSIILFITLLYWSIQYHMHFKVVEEGEYKYLRCGNILYKPGMQLPPMSVFKNYEMEVIPKDLYISTATLSVPEEARIRLGIREIAMINAEFEIIYDKGQEQRVINKKIHLGIALQGWLERQLKELVTTESVQSLNQLINGFNNNPELRESHILRFEGYHVRWAQNCKLQIA